MASYQQNTQAMLCGHYEEHHWPSLTPVATVRENAKSTQNPMCAAPGPKATQPTSGAELTNWSL